MTILFNIVFSLEFMFHGYCAYVYCSSVFKERKSTINSLFLFLSASMAEFCVYVLFENTPINISIMILLTTAVCVFCFKSKVIMCFLHSFILTGIFGMSELFSVPIANIVVSENYFASHKMESELIVSTVSKLIFFVICKVISMISKKESATTKSIWLLTVPLMSLICGLAVTSLSDLHDSNGEIKFNIVIMIFAVTMLIINIVVFAVHENYVKAANETQKIRLLEQKKELDYKHYKVLESEYNDSRILIHDIKHHSNTISALADSKDEQGMKNYIESVKKCITSFGGQVYTGNKIIDIILYQKSEVCFKEGINFHFKSNNIKMEFIDEADICCILSNLLDNAIEAAQKSENRSIELTFYSNIQKTIYFIEITNSCDIPPIIKNGRMITEKSNSRYHGVGIYSVEKTLKKYSGYLSYHYDNNDRIFQITVTIKK